MPNHLANETSPYLLQHKNNPVDWYPWGEEAFAKAKREGKMVFLSVGYSTCHWCHVMAHESFETAEIAAVMNELFVNIKVDREERPDIDRIYMSAAYALGRPGGWPLSVVLTPDGKPFFSPFLPNPSTTANCPNLSANASAPIRFHRTSFVHNEPTRPFFR